MDNITTTDLNSHILDSISRIAGKHKVIIGQNVQTKEIKVMDFADAGVVVHFTNDLNTFMDTLNLLNYTTRTSFNPYEIRINWRVK